MIGHSDILRRTVVGYEILHVPEDVCVAFVQGPGHRRQVLILGIVEDGCWLRVENERYRKQSLKRP